MGRPHGNAEARRRAVCAALEQRSDWLLIFDDAPGPCALTDYLPAERTGHILVTSRNPNWLHLAQVLPAGGFERAEATHLLRTRSARADAETDSLLAAARL